MHLLRLSKKKMDEKLIKGLTRNISLTLVLKVIILEVAPKAQAAKAKINYWAYVRLRTTNKMKRRPREWEKIWQTVYQIRGQYPIYKVITQFNSQQIDNLIKNEQKIWKDIFPKTTMLFNIPDSQRNPNQITWDIISYLFGWLL